MDGGIATIWAAAIGLVAGSGGALLSGVFAYKVGRRQVLDQEVSAHRQWLMQQRQEAYVAYLSSSHILIRAVDDCFLALGTAEATNDFSIYENATECVDVAAYRAIEISEGGTDHPLDSILMLGPTEVSECARSLRTDIRSLVANLAHLTNGVVPSGPAPPDLAPLDDWWSVVERSKDEVLASQANFVAAAHSVLSNAQAVS